MKIISYKKYADNLVTHALSLPDDQNGQAVGTELATLSDGLTYVAMPATTTLPAQVKEIAASVKAVTLAVAQIAAIKAASPHVALINQRVRNKITEKYSVADEIKMLRLAPSPETTAYNVYVEDMRAWGQAEKAKLGL